VGRAKDVALTGLAVALSLYAAACLAFLVSVFLNAVILGQQ
jgi:hypothetical protein